MALADHVREPTTKGPPCTVCFALRTLPSAEAAALQTLLEDESWRYTEITDALKDETGLHIAPGTIGKHVRGRCSAKTKIR